MSQYKENKLKQYIETSTVIPINENLKIRLPKEYLEKYKLGVYDNAIKHWQGCIEEIQSIKINYPSNAKPIFYIYIVLDNQFVELLNFPKELVTKGGGKPISAYDLDSYSCAYGTSSNLMENKNDLSISQKTNCLHELAHLIQSMFFSDQNQYLGEGFAETIVFYILGYDEIYLEHRNLLTVLKEEQILTVKELIELGNQRQFHPPRLIPHSTCSFEITYISSYLFVRGIIKKIEEKYGVDKFEASQKFLEMIRSLNRISEWLVFDIASFLGLPKEILLYGKELQLNVLSELKENIQENKIIR